MSFFLFQDPNQDSTFVLHVKSPKGPVIRIVSQTFLVFDDINSSEEFLWGI